MKISLNKPASGYNLAAINDNFTKLETEFQTKVLYRNNPSGEPNTMETDLDMNGHAIYNLSELSVGGVNISEINSALIWRGTWSSATAYAVSDAVYYNGSSYIAVAANTNSTPPSANWNVLAAQGASGAGTGDVVGPASSTLNNIALYASGTGKLLKDSSVTLALGGAVESFLESATAATARAAIGAAETGANSSITSLTGLTAGGLPDNSVLTNDIANGAVTPAKLSQPLTLGTIVNTTSGTAIDFTSIPSWVKRVTLLLNRVSTSGTSNLLVQLGAGSVQNTGYLSNANSPTNPIATSTAGFLVTAYTVAANTQSGRITFETLGSNIWVASGISAFDVANNSSFSGGSVTLSGTIDRLRFTTVNGTDTFDAGSVNILYEG